MNLQSKILCANDFRAKPSRRQETVPFFWCRWMNNQYVTLELFKYIRRSGLNSACRFWFREKHTTQFSSNRGKKQQTITGYHEVEDYNILQKKIIRHFIVSYSSFAIYFRFIMSCSWAYAAQFLYQRIAKHRSFHGKIHRSLVVALRVLCVFLVFFSTHFTRLSMAHTCCWMLFFDYYFGIYSANISFRLFCSLISLGRFSLIIFVRFIRALFRSSFVHSQIASICLAKCSFRATFIFGYTTCGLCLLHIMAKYSN